MVQKILTAYIVTMYLSGSKTKVLMNKKTNNKTKKNNQPKLKQAKLSVQFSGND